MTASAGSTCCVGLHPLGKISACEITEHARCLEYIWCGIILKFPTGCALSLSCKAGLPQGRVSSRGKASDERNNLYYSFVGSLGALARRQEGRSGTCTRVPQVT